MLDLMTLYTTQRKQYAHWSAKYNNMVGTQEEFGSEIINLAIGIRVSLPQTYYCRLSR